MTGYFVEMQSQFSSRWTKVNKKAISQLTLTLDDLSEGEKYEVKVAAENEAGIGTFCEPISFVAKDPFGKATKKCHNVPKNSHYVICKSINSPKNP